MPPSADADELDDLDDSAGAQDDGGARPRRALPHWARSRWGLPVVATAVVVLVGAASVHQVRVAAATDLARAQQLGALQLSTPTVVFDDGTPQRDARGRLLQEVQVQAFNAGSDPVEVTPLATSLTTAELLGALEPLAIAPGTGTLLVLPLAVDCEAVPPLDQVVTIDPATGIADAGGETTWLQLAVDLGGERTDRRYPVPGQSRSGGLTEQLSYACAPNAYSQEVSAATVVDAEGRLQVSVVNASPDPARLLLQAPPSLGASSDVPLPADVPASSSLQLVLTLDPVCDLAAPEPGDYPLEAALALDTGDGSSRSLTGSTVTTAWVARQVALRCG